MSPLKSKLSAGGSRDRLLGVSSLHGEGMITPRELAQALVRKVVRLCWVRDARRRVLRVANSAFLIRALEKVGLRPVGEPLCLKGEDEPSVKYALTRCRFDHQGG